jgi:hypothetical protein
MSAGANVHPGRFRAGALNEIRQIRTSSYAVFTAREYRHRSAPLITRPGFRPTRMTAFEIQRYTSIRSKRIE